MKSELDDIQVALEAFDNTNERLRERSSKTAHEWECYNNNCLAIDKAKKALKNIRLTLGK